jgi:energy-coupling factor transport system permease protein
MIRNPLAWCLWAVAALLAAFIDRNPFVQALLLLVLINVWLPYRQGRSAYLRIWLALALIPVVFSVALSRFGRHVLFVAPPIPVVGGVWTWEAVAFGASSGAALVLAVAVFRILHATVRSADLIALLPPLFYRAGTVFALSVAFAPKTIASFQAIRESRELRGRRAGWQSAPALLVSLLLTTLEQALQYAESLDARGYGSGRRSRYRPIAWGFADAILIGSSLAGLLLLVSFPAGAYNAYQQLMPASPPALSVVAVLLLSTPAILAIFQRGD